MKFKLPEGECCSCGRTVAMRGARTCPYCSEAVLWPLKWRMAGWMTLYIPFALIAIGLSGGLNFDFYPASYHGKWLFWSAWVLTLLPSATGKLVVSSQSGLRRWRLWMMLGQVYAGFILWWSAAVFASAPFLAVVAGMCVCAMPLFWMVPLRIWAVGILLFYAL